MLSAGRQQVRRGCALPKVTWFHMAELRLELRLHTCAQGISTALCCCFFCTQANWSKCTPASYPEFRSQWNGQGPVCEQKRVTCEAHWAQLTPILSPRGNTPGALNMLLLILVSERPSDCLQVMWLLNQYVSLGLSYLRTMSSPECHCSTANRVTATPPQCRLTAIIFGEEGGRDVASQCITSAAMGLLRELPFEIIQALQGLSHVLELKEASGQAEVRLQVAWV